MDSEQTVPTAEVDKQTEGNKEKGEGSTDNGNGTDSSSFEDLSVPELGKDKTEESETEKEPEWLDILGSGSLMKKIIKPGESDTRPQRSDDCKIRLVGKLEDGTVVEMEEEMELQVGDMELVQGLDLALPLMNVGETAVLSVEPRLAYGEEGRTPDIPPNAKLEYEIELLSAEPSEELELMSIAKRKRIGNRKRERGNWWYARNECNYAIQCYRRALDFLDDVEGGITDPTSDGELKPTDADLQALLEDRMKVYNNMAAAQMKLEAYDSALQSVDNVLRCQPNNVKALFRKGKILDCKNEPTEALKVLRQALSLQPSNTAVIMEIQRLTTRAQRHRDKERDLAKRMLRQTAGGSDRQMHKSTKSSKMFFWASIVGSVSIGIAALAAYRYKYA